MQSSAERNHLEYLMDTTTGRHAISTVIAALVEAWRLHDADAYGELFTADATYTTFLGTHYRGRSDITESHRTLFSGFVKGTRLADEILDIRFFGPDTAVVTGRGDTYRGRQPKKLSKVQTYTMVREADGQWRIAAFHNTKSKPLMENISFKVAPGLVPAAQQ
ncbi:SgcJ/EcaC family oxidoreductase [Streptomyces sp. NBC_01210]|uniref:SgcJ/EcaC family oxidoreductase n=1 Tax=Streptomyces sp. NBC_01210 TaxID=2903774 RepID=UPI002E0F3C2B|nr:SgcJ/EcaC family oxidoreductase [Streptomyces sp. NBC_01210]